MCSFVISIFLNACESWTLTAELEKTICRASEMRCYRRLLNISYKDHVTYAGSGQAKMAWPCFKVFWFSKDNPTGQKQEKYHRFFL